LCNGFAFLARKKRIHIDGDDFLLTLFSFTGGMAAAYYKYIPKEIIDFVVEKLPAEYIEIMNQFDEHCMK
jgi:hypothetical protein